MMSISPQAGQPSASMLAPRSQKAGHMPVSDGSLILASKRP
jgi:hypothetical protein